MQMTAGEEARALIGAEYAGGAFGRRILGHLSCTDQGAGVLQIGGVVMQEWWHARLECQGRQVILLKQPLRAKDGKGRWRIVDTLVLPPLRLLTEPYAPSVTNDLWLFDAGECSLDDRFDSHLIALVRWTDRDLIDWRTGVEHAWTFDLERQRIVPVSTKRVMCEQPIVD